MMTDEHPYWFAWRMDECAIQVRVCDGVAIRQYQIARREIGVFDNMWIQLISKGFAELAYAPQEETR
jgi:hypothetical protein